jgi:serine protease Do
MCRIVKVSALCEEETMPGRASCGQAFALLSAAALAVLVGSPGAASADGGRPQVNPDERAAAMIRPTVMYLAAEAYGRVRLPSDRTLPNFDEGLNWP